MKKKKRNIIGLKLTYFIILGFILWISKTLINQNTMIKELYSRKSTEEKEIAKLEKEIEELNEEIESQDSLPFIEKTARERLRMVKPREIIYIDKNKGKGFFRFFEE